MLCILTYKYTGTHTSTHTLKHTHINAHTKECGLPEALLNVPWSIFNKQVDDTGPQSSVALRRMAAKGPEGEEAPHQNWG